MSGGRLLFVETVTFSHQRFVAEAGVVGLRFRTCPTTDVFDLGRGGLAGRVRDIPRRAPGPVVMPVPQTFGFLLGVPGESEAQRIRADDAAQGRT